MTIHECVCGGAVLTLSAQHSSADPECTGQAQFKPQLCACCVSFIPLSLHLLICKMVNSLELTEG